MNRKQVENLIIETLQGIGLYSPEAVQLLLATAAHESDMGEYLRQYPQGPALGIFQVERATFNDILNRFLAGRESLRAKIQKECNCFALVPEAMVYNIKLAICFARLVYLPVPKKLPDIGDWDEVAKYWKKHYNTYLGAGTEGEFLKSCKDHGLC